MVGYTQLETDPEKQKYRSLQRHSLIKTFRPMGIFAKLPVYPLNLREAFDDLFFKRRKRQSSSQTNYSKPSITII